MRASTILLLLPLISCRTPATRAPTVETKPAQPTPTSQKVKPLQVAGDGTEEARGPDSPKEMDSPLVAAPTREPVPERRWCGEEGGLPFSLPSPRLPGSPWLSSMNAPPGAGLVVEGAHRIQRPEGLRPLRSRDGRAGKTCEALGSGEPETRLASPRELSNAGRDPR